MAVIIIYTVQLVPTLYHLSPAGVLSCRRYALSTTSSSATDGGKLITDLGVCMYMEEFLSLHVCGTSLVPRPTRYYNQSRDESLGRPGDEAM